jgi:hypothetical protein
MSGEKVGPWTKEEDEKLKLLVNGQTNIAAVKWRSVESRHAMPAIGRKNTW